MDGLTHGLYLALVAAVAPLGFADRLVSAEPVAATVRAVKTPAEIERMRRACAITQRIFDDLTGMLKPALTEGEIAEIVRERMQTYEVDQPVRRFIADRGYTFTHALGHQLGRLAHDGGMVLGPDNARYGERARGVVAAGMVFTLEPVVGSAMIEDDVVVIETGCEFLVPTQRDLPGVMIARS